MILIFKWDNLEAYFTFAQSEIHIQNMFSDCVI